MEKIFAMRAWRAPKTMQRNLFVEFLDFSCFFFFSRLDEDKDITTLTAIKAKYAGEHEAGERERDRVCVRERQRRK